MIKLPTDIYTQELPIFDLKFPELKEHTTYVFEEQIELQRWLVAELNKRWFKRQVTNLVVMTQSVNDFIRMVFRHYYDQGTNFTLQGKRLLGFDAVWEQPVSSFKLNPIVEQGPMTVEVREIEQ